MKIWKQAIAALLASTLRLASAGDTGTGPNNPEKIGDGVEEEINMNGFAVVMIALEETSPSAESPTTCTELFEDIADSYFPIFEYSFPGCAGNITSTDGLYYIADTSDVIKIDLDLPVEATGESGVRVRKLLRDSVPLVGADERHSLGNKGAGVTVAVLDTGIENDHPDFPLGTIVHEACFSRNNDCGGATSAFGFGTAAEGTGHGTHVAGIIASRGNVADEGMAPDASIVAIKVLFGPNGSGFTSGIVAGMDYIANNPNNDPALANVSVINMSLGGGRYTGPCDNADAATRNFAAASQRLLDNNVLTISSSGNGGSTTQIGRPACVSTVVAVGNSDDNDNRAPSSDSNAQVDLFAPGTSIVAPYPSAGTASLTGTSMASPHAAGCAALLIESGEAVAAQDIRSRLATSPVTVTAGLRTFPRLDCSAAPSSAPSPMPSAKPSNAPSSMPTISLAPSSSPSCTPKGSKTQGKGASKSAKCAGKGKGGR